jgi:hypothetical protein
MSYLVGVDAKKEFGTHFFQAIRSSLKKNKNDHTVLKLVVVVFRNNDDLVILHPNSSLTI